MRPRLEQLESISQLLLGGAEATRLLGLELLLQFPEYVGSMRRELILAHFFAETPEGKERLGRVLARHFNPKIIEQQLGAFAVFEQARRYAFYPLHSPTLYRLVRDHENLRPDYILLMERNTHFLAHYVSVVECIGHKLPRLHDLALRYCRWLLPLLPGNTVLADWERCLLP